MPWYYRIGLVLGLLFQLHGAHASELELELRPDVLLREPQIKLGDLVIIHAADAVYQRQLEDLVVGRAPLIGHLEQRTRAELDLLLHSQVFQSAQAIAWRGATAVKIRRASQPLAAERLAAVARQYLQSQYGSGLSGADIRLEGALPELAAPLGEVRLVARMAAPGRLRSRMPVWVDVVVQGGVYRSVVVPLLVSVPRPVYVARRALAAGGSVTAADFDLSEQDIAVLADEALTPDRLGGAGRMRQGLEAGQVATLRQVAPAGMVLRGDQVRLQTAAAGIAIETDAYAQADGKLGQHIPVRPAHSDETIMAWVSAPGVVRVEGR
jgi:flagella basal body P-ring formation protein FlgA